MTKVKICGITNIEDALASCEYGADALGFIFYKKSPRFIEPERVKKIIRELPPFVTTVGVFVDDDADRISEIADAAKLDIIQLHGSEPPEFCNVFKRKIIKAFKIQGQGARGKGQENEIRRYTVSAYLLDTYKEGVEGGTGEIFDWEIAKEAKRFGRIIVAGGLTPENVAEAVETVMPYGVDVSSGVEQKPGKKDLQKVKNFIERAKGIA